jgi:dihydroorotase
MVELFSTGPSTIFNLNRGSLKSGSPADVTIFDPERMVKVDSSTFQSKSRNTPFEGWELKGSSVATIVGGRLVWSKR